MIGAILAHPFLAFVVVILLVLVTIARPGGSRHSVFPAMTARRKASMAAVSSVQ